MPCIRDPCSYSSFNLKSWSPMIVAATSVLSLLLLVLSTPIIQSISFGSVPVTNGQSNGTITFGALGYCIDMKEVLPPNDAIGASLPSNDIFKACSTKSLRLGLMYTLDSTLLAQVPMGQTITFLGVFYVMALSTAIIVCISSAFFAHYFTATFKFVVMAVAVVAILSTLIAFINNLIFILHFKQVSRHSGLGIWLPIIAICLLVLFIGLTACYTRQKQDYYTRQQQAFRVQGMAGALDKQKELPEILPPTVEDISWEEMLK